MTDNSSSSTKKTVRKKTTATPTAETADINSSPASSKSINTLLASFCELIAKINQEKTELENLQKEISQTKEIWLKEQKDHGQKVKEQEQQEELQKKREQETYEYETAMKHKREEDDFNQRKAQWEKELKERQEEIQKDKEELEVLRKQASGFESEKEKAVKEVLAISQKTLTDKFEAEKKLSDQEEKSEKEILGLKISSLTAENARQANEIETLKKSLEEATRQVKEIAVKVIESGASSLKTPPQNNNS